MGGFQKVPKFDSRLEKAEFRVRTLGVLVWASSLQILCWADAAEKKHSFSAVAVSLAAFDVTQRKPQK